MNLIENALSGNGTRSLFRISRIPSLSFETRSDQKAVTIECRTNKLCRMSCRIDPLPRGQVPPPQVAYIALLHTMPWENKSGPRLQLRWGWTTGTELLEWYTVLQLFCNFGIQSCCFCLPPITRIFLLSPKKLPLASGEAMDVIMLSPQCLHGCEIWCWCHRSTGYFEVTGNWKSSINSLLRRVCTWYIWTMKDWKGCCC